MTLADLLNEASLRLSCVAGQEYLHRPVSWVHTAEVRDPAPWLSADVLLLTTAIVERSAAELNELFASLSGNGVSAVGFGVGLTHPEIPKAWIAASQTHRIPLLQVPIDTPYIAISEMVSRRRTEAQFSQITKMLDVQRALASGHSSEGAHQAALTTLSRELNCRIFEQGPGSISEINGSDLEISEAETAFIADELGLQSANGNAVMSTSIGDLHIQLASIPHMRIAAVRRARFTPLEQNLIETTALLLRASSVQSPPMLKQRLLGDVISGRLELPGRVYSYMFPALPQCAVVCFLPADSSLDDGVVDEEEIRRSFLDRSGNPADDDDGSPFILNCTNCIYAITGDPNVVSADSLTTLLPNLAETSGHWRAGISRTAPPVQLPELCRQARRAAEDTPRGTVNMYTEADEREALLRAWSMNAEQRALTKGWSDRLAQLTEKDRQRIISALYAFLNNNGAVERTASELGIHRQTLNSRLAQAENRLRIDLDSPLDRALLWLALSSGLLNSAPPR